MFLWHVVFVECCLCLLFPSAVLFDVKKKGSGGKCSDWIWRGLAKHVCALSTGQECSWTVGLMLLLLQWIHLSTLSPHNPRYDIIQLQRLPNPPINQDQLDGKYLTIPLTQSQPVAIQTLPSPLTEAAWKKEYGTQARPILCPKWPGRSDLTLPLPVHWLFKFVFLLATNNDEVAWELFLGGGDEWGFTEGLVV